MYVTPGDIRAIPYRLELVRELERQLAPPQQFQLLWNAKNDEVSIGCRHFCCRFRSSKAAEQNIEIGLPATRYQFDRHLVAGRRRLRQLWTAREIVFAMLQTDLFTYATLKTFFAKSIYKVVVLFTELDTFMLEHLIISLVWKRVDCIKSETN